MVANDLLDILPIQLKTNNDQLNQKITGVYCGDLLSLVMANAKDGNMWITIQNHINVVAVASLVGIVAIIVVEGIPVAQEVIAKAEEEDIVIFTTKKSAYDIASICAQKISFDKE